MLQSQLNQIIPNSITDTRVFTVDIAESFFAKNESYTYYILHELACIPSWGNAIKVMIGSVTTQISPHRQNLITFILVSKMVQNSFFKVRLETKSQGTVSSRGFLLEYWSVGCATPRDPGFGFMNYRNDSHATFSCSLGHVFTSNLERTKTIFCMEDQWSDTDNSCVSVDFLRSVLSLFLSSYKTIAFRKPVNLWLGNCNLLKWTVKFFGLLDMKMRILKDNFLLNYF